MAPSLTCLSRFLSPAPRTSLTLNLSPLPPFHPFHFHPVAPEMADSIGEAPQLELYAAGVLNRAIAGGLSDRSKIAPHAVRRNLKPRSENAYFRVMSVWHE